MIKINCGRIVRTQFVCGGPTDLVLRSESPTEPSFILSQPKRGRERLRRIKRLDIGLVSPMSGERLLHIKTSQPVVSYRDNRYDRGIYYYVFDGGDTIEWLQDGKLKTESCVVVVNVETGEHYETYPYNGELFLPRGKYRFYSWIGRTSIDVEYL